MYLIVMTLRDKSNLKKHLTKDKLNFFPSSLLVLLHLGRFEPSGQISDDASVHKINEKPGRLVERIY